MTPAGCSMKCTQAISRNGENPATFSRSEFSELAIQPQRRCFTKFLIRLGLWKSVCELWDGVEARVLFSSKVEAAEAFGEFHDRNIYDGCCQLDIKRGISQECEAIPMRSVSTLLRASATPISITNDFEPNNINFDKEPVFDDEPVIDVFDVVSSGGNIPDLGLAMVYGIATEHVVEATQAVVTSIDTNVPVQPVDVPAAVELDVVNCPSHTTVAFLLIAVLFEDVPTPMEASEISPPKLSVGIELDTPSPEKCSMVCLDHVIDVQASASTVSTAMKFLNSGSMLYDMAIPWVLPVKRVARQPWPPPMLFEILHESAQIRPLPWPFFISRIYCFMSLNVSFVWKPLWLLQLRLNIRCVPATVLLKFLKCILVNPVRVGCAEVE